LAIINKKDAQDCVISGLRADHTHFYVEVKFDNVDSSVDIVPIGGF